MINRFECFGAPTKGVRETEARTYVLDENLGVSSIVDETIEGGNVVDLLSVVAEGGVGIDERVRGESWTKKSFWRKQESVSSFSNLIELSKEAQKMHNKLKSRNMCGIEGCRRTFGGIFREDSRVLYIRGGHAGGTEHLSERNLIVLSKGRSSDCAKKGGQNQVLDAKK